jgi:hypothetical protein
MNPHRFLPACARLRAASIRLASAGVAGFLLAACIGGTGTDTDNGIVRGGDKGPLSGTGTAARVVDASGNPLPGVTVSLHRPDFHPDSSAEVDLVLDSVKAPVTDSDGYVKFNLIQPGAYVVEASRGDAVLLFDTLVVADVKALAAFTFIARPGRDVEGHVRLASGLQVASGSIFIRGTSRRSALDPAGGYDLGTLPSDVALMSIGLTYRAIAVEARVAEQKDTARGSPVTTTPPKPAFVCREVAVDSAARLGSASGLASKDSFGNPTFISPDTVKLDTARVNAVSRSCDSLPGGTVIAVRTPAPGWEMKATKDSVTTNLIVVDPANGYALPASGTLPPAKLVPLNGCVANPGTVSTTYEVRLQSTTSGADLHVGDVADQCL